MYVNGINIHSLHFLMEFVNIYVRDDVTYVELQSSLRGRIENPIVVITHILYRQNKQKPIITQNALDTG